MTRSTARSSSSGSSDVAAPGTKKTSAKKAGASKTGASKTGASKTGARKASAKKASAQGTAAHDATVEPAISRNDVEAEASQRQAPGRGSAPRTQSRPERSSEREREETSDADGSSGPLGASQIALQATAHLLDLSGKEAEGVVGIAKAEAGWVVQIEILELRRIPSTTDVLAIYEVTLDDGGALVGYRRLQRYVRGTPRED